MKKLSLMLLVIVAVSSILSAAQKGGTGPCLATCCIGPRVGLEMNEGTKIRQSEWIAFIGGMIFSPIRLINVIDPFTGKTMDEVRAAEKLGGNPIMAKEPAEQGGIKPLLGTCCFGPRVGLELNDGRKIRTMEWLTLIPVVNIVPTVIMASEAYSGKTMTDVAAAEGLDR